MEEIYHLSMFILGNLGKSIRKEKLEQENICFYKETAQLLCLHPYLSDFFRNSIKELANLLKCFVMNQMFFSNLLFDSESHQLHPTKGNNSYYYYGIETVCLINQSAACVWPKIYRKQKSGHLYSKLNAGTYVW